MSSNVNDPFYTLWYVGIWWLMTDTVFYVVSITPAAITFPGLTWYSF